MILFLWSIVLSGVSQVRRHQLFAELGMLCSRIDVGVLLRRLSAVGKRFVDGASLLYTVNDVELLSLSKKSEASSLGWHRFDDTDLKLSDSSNIPTVSSLVFVGSVALQSTSGPIENAFRIDNDCIPLAWRSTSPLDVLFLCRDKLLFMKCANAFIDRQLVYRGCFEVVQIQTTSLSSEFRSLLGLKEAAISSTNGSPRRPAHFLETMEEMCLEDILRSRRLCASALLCNGGVNNNVLKESWTESVLNNAVVTSQPSVSVSLPSSPIVTVEDRTLPDAMSTLASFGRSEDTVATLSTHSNRLNLGHCPDVVVFENQSHPDLSSTPAASCSLSSESVQQISKSCQSMIDVGMEYAMRASRTQLETSFDGNGRVAEKASSSRQEYFPSRRSIGRASFSEVADDICERRSSRGSIDSLEVKGRLWQNRGSQRRRSSCSPISALASIRSLTTSSSSATATGGDTGKPPNIYIFTGALGKSGEPELFDRLKSTLLSCVGRDRYTVYPLSVDQLTGVAWQQTAHLLVVASGDLADAVWKVLFAYFKQNGKLLFVCQNSLLAYLQDCASARKRLGMLKLAFSSDAANKEFERFLKNVSKQVKRPKIHEQFNVRRSDGSNEYFISVIREEHSPLLMYLQNASKRAGALFSDVTFDALLESGGSKLIKEALKRLEISVASGQLGDATGNQLTPGYVIWQDKHVFAQFSREAKGMHRLVSPKLSLEFISSFSTKVIPSSDYLPIFTCEECGSGAAQFNKNSYFAHLTAKRLGRVVLFVPIATSTMDIFERLTMQDMTHELGMIAVAAQQTTGYGRSENQWLSPIGAAMFTFAIRVDLQSVLGSSLGFVQHLAALSVVDSILQDKEYKGSLDLRLKWPNDIYIGAQTKVGGVLLKSTLKGSTVYCTIGIGVNVANSLPTTCLNDHLLPRSPRLCVETVIAKALSRFEELLVIFERAGCDKILQLYYKYWIHQNQVVTVESTGDTALICGLDRDGFLRVKSTLTGEQYSLQPDGNSFDMMHNLIRMKD